MMWPVLAALATTPFTAADLVALNRVSDPQVSPDGRYVAYVIRETDLEANKGRTGVWLLDGTAGAPPRRLTQHPANDTSPRWSPDGRTLYFLSTRSGSSQIWRLALAGGDPVAVTALAEDVGSFKVAPTGDRLVFSMAVKSAPGAKAPAKASGQIHDKLFVRHWDTWADGSRSHLFSVKLDAQGAAGTPVDLSKELDGDTSKPFGGDEEYAIPRWQARGVFAAGSGAHGAVVDELRSLRNAHRRRHHNEPDDSKPRLGYPARVSRQRRSCIPRDGSARLRGRPFPRRCAQRKDRNRTAAHTGVGSFSFPTRGDTRRQAAARDG